MLLNSVDSFEKKDEDSPAGLSEHWSPGVHVVSYCLKSGKLNWYTEPDEHRSAGTYNDWGDASRDEYHFLLEVRRCSFALGFLFVLKSLYTRFSSHTVCFMTSPSSCNAPFPTGKPLYHLCWQRRQ